jgi:hypothetical protein
MSIQVHTYVVKVEKNLTSVISDVAWLETCGWGTKPCKQSHGLGSRWNKLMMGNVLSRVTRCNCEKIAQNIFLTELMHNPNH